MQIAIDANEANVKTRVGTGQYTHELLSRWHADSRHDFTLFLKNPPLSSLPPSGPHWQYRLLRPSRAWTRFALPLHLSLSRRFDVFFSPAHYLPPVTGCPSVVTIHDLAYEYFPSLFLPADRYKLSRWTRAAVKQATRVIAVSEATKQDLVKLYHTPADKIVVIPNGYNTTLFSINNTISPKLLDHWPLTIGHYILFLGTLQPRKNVTRLVQAFRLLKENGYRGKLVLAGQVGWLADELLDIIRTSPDHDDIIMTGYVPDETRQALYTHAEVFCLPSLYEGFGVPVLEAMASGCPVAAADNSSLPEVVGEAGLLFNPADPADIAAAITTLHDNRAKYVKLGLAQAKKFSWTKCAAETLKVLTSPNIR